MSKHASLAIKVSDGGAFDLHQIDPKQTGEETRATAEARFATLDAQLGELQELLYAARFNSVLVVLQGLDTSGKDGTVRHVMASVNPQGCRVESFKVPTLEEASHDFLWRAHRVTPGLGTLTIFNRSYYEDVLVTRVHNLVPETVWRPRYDLINHFERLLIQQGTIILKFFLHISKDEQKRRLLAREHDPEKAWKISSADWIERRSWNAYQGAYEEAIHRCSTDEAPWYIVPADRKWYRNLAVAQTIVETLDPYRKSWLSHLRAVGKQALEDLRTVRGDSKRA